jgi:hypothetical protein
MTDNPAEVVESVEPRRSMRHYWRRMAIVLAITLLLFGVPWWTLLAPSASWPTAVFVVGTLLFVAAFAAMPLLMVFGHGRRHLDWAASTGDTLLGAAWVMFVWSLLGQLLRLVLLTAGVADPVRSRLVAGAVLCVVVVLLAWGYAEAMRVPRVKRVDVAIARLGPGLDGLRVAVMRMSRVLWNFGGGPVSIRLRSPDHCARRVRHVWRLRVRARPAGRVGVGAR